MLPISLEEIELEISALQRDLEGVAHSEKQASRLIDNCRDKRKIYEEAIKKLEEQKKNLEFQQEVVFRERVFKNFFPVFGHNTCTITTGGYQAFKLSIKELKKKHNLSHEFMMELADAINLLKG